MNVRNFLKRQSGLAAAALLALAAGTGGAAAATFNLFEAGTTTLLGTFQAPGAGGAITAMSVTVAGITFDTLGTGTQAPSYDAADNDIGGTGASLGAVYNSAAVGICGVGECAFSFYPIYDFATPIPGEWYADKVFPLTDQQSISLGFYEVALAPIPVPATAFLQFSALGLAGALAWRRRRRAASR
ncbi:MAG: hypothetical protein KDK02_11625 [Rhodobacteraceae bacterium]|nr:hypothetical protein [Paracoccaceae bacterium]